MIPQHEILEAAKEAGLYMTSPERISAVERLVAIIERKTIERAAVAAEDATRLSRLALSSILCDGEDIGSCHVAAAIRKLGDE